MRKVTVTFDNGPDPDVTPMVLATLKRHDVLATFFVLGDKLRDRMRFAERAHAEGHWIGNHTFNHLVPFGCLEEPETAVWEIARTQELIGNLAHSRRFFRPLGRGSLGKQLLNPRAVHFLTAEEYTCVLWNSVPQDWIYTGGWVEKAVDMCLQQEHTCLVLHDLPTGSMDHLDRFLNALTDHGVRFTQDFPTSCVPIEKGRTIGSLEDYVTLARSCEPGS